MSSNSGSRLPALVFPSTASNLSSPSPLSTASVTPGPRQEKPLPAMPRVGGELDDHVEDSELERGSWVDIADGDDLDSPYTRNFPSIPVVPPTYLPNPMQPRSRAQTPSVPKDDSWSPKNDRHPPARAPSASPPVSLASPSSPPTASQSYQQSHSPLLRSVSGSESSLLTDSLSGRSFARPPRSTLPDPSQFPDPYPFRPPHHHMTSNLPALSSAGSSSASTRSSAYTSSGSALASGDYGHVHVASGDEEGAVGVGITSDDVVQLMASDSSSSSVTSPPRSRAPIDQSRWSESYSVSSRSRSSSVGQNNLSVSQDGIAQNLVHRPSFDIGWQPVDERDEVGMSEEETDDDAVTGEDEIDEEDEERDEERTSAIVIAEEGRGLIVQGEGLPVAQLQVQAGTTHLIVGSSSTPNAMPSFLSNILPQITHTLLALDISANFLGALPPCLAACQFLEELNIAFNPLRVLPVFLSELVSLRVLIADSTGIGTLPDPISELSKLHTLSLRRNKMHALPSWLCLLNSLQTLYVDGNPFQGPWKALVEPLLAKLPMTPIYPTSTPVHLLPSASIASSSPSGTEHETTDNEEYADSPNSSNIPPYVTSLEEEDQTVTPDKTQPISRPQSQSQSSSRGLARTRTTPNREFYSKARAKTIVESGTPNFSQPAIPPEPIGTQGSTREVRKMKSAGDLRRGQPGIIPDSPAISPPRPILPVSASSSNLLSQERPSFPKRFASVGPSVGQPPARRTLTRPNTSAGPQSIWDQTQVSEKDDHVNEIRPIRPIRPIHQPVSAESSPPRRYHDSRHSEYSKEPKEKSSKWGFLKKMSMGRIRPLESTTPQTSPGRSPRPRPTGVDRFSKTPQIDMRFSTLGSFDPIPVTSVTSAPNPFVSVSPPQLEKKPSMAALVSTSANQTPTATPPRNLTPSNNLLGLPAITPRATKRRSFLPLDVPVSLNIPEPSAFVQGVAVQNGDEPDEAQNSTPCPSPDTEQLIKREEERAREAYSRALRSVMAYLKDMNDLGLSQAPSPMSTYDDSNSSRARRPTIVERESTTAVGTNSQLRSRESMSALRSGTTSQTMSVATTDSTGSGEERKFKDDKGKRVMVVREIVETERTYVKGLRELFDIYIRPGSVPVNLITGVSSSKETVVPQAERKVVFGAVDSLFSFHKDNFLPALERATAPLMKPQSALQEADADGQLSLKVAREVGNVFLKHAAFLKMYSSYINNFDTAVTRVKQWTSDRHPTSAASPISSLSPSSSTAQLAGLGLAMSALAPSIAPDTNSSSLSVPNLTSSQRKRIRTYLKRCRMNPRHSQLNLEGYLLLPVQRIPRYRLLLEELLRSTPPTFEFVEDPLDRALAEILSLANNMNEGKRESESRRKLVQWQARIRGKFPSPLVQPHRRLIMDGPLLLTRVVRKAVVSFETFNAHGDSAIVQVDCLAPELTPRQLVGILCNDLLVLCRDPTEGQDPSCFVDLWAVLRMQTLPQPASIVHSNALRLVDNKAILYFDAPSPSDALNWFRAINLHIPASKA